MIDVEFWQTRYTSGNTPWDLDGPSPHLLELFSQPPSFLKPGRTAVPGSGKGHDAALFGKNGFDVIGFDYSSGAISEASHRYGQIAKFEQTDFFTLADPASPWSKQFDYIVEHTCFCAIQPDDRASYARAAANLLKPGGYLIGIFWEHRELDGPPFSTTVAQIQEVFLPAFELVSMTPCSAENTRATQRSGVERLTILRLVK